MSDREKARKAIDVWNSLAKKRDEQRQLEKKLKRAFYDQAYDSRHRRADYRDLLHSRCAACGEPFSPGQEVLEFVSDDGREVFVRYHYHSDECGGFT